MDYIQLPVVWSQNELVELQAFRSCFDHLLLIKIGYMWAFANNSKLTHPSFLCLLLGLHVRHYFHMSKATKENHKDDIDSYGDPYFNPIDVADIRKVHRRMITLFFNYASLAFSKVCGLWLCEYDLCIDSSIQCFSVGVSGWELQCWGVYLLGIYHVVCIGCSDISKGGGWTPITTWHQANDKENLAKVRALGSVSRHLPLFGSSHPFYVGPILSQSVRMCKTVAGVPGSVGCSLQKGLKSVWCLIQNSSTCPYEICLPFSLGTTCWNNWCSCLQESRHAGCDPSYTEEIGLGGYMGWWLRVIHIAWGCHPCCCLYNTRDPSVPTLAAEQVWT